MRQRTVDINRLCSAEPPGDVHTWESTGLDTVDDVLSTTRRCVRCGVAEHKPYGAGSRKGWKR